MRFHRQSDTMRGASLWAAFSVAVAVQGCGMEEPVEHQDRGLAPVEVESEIVEVPPSSGGDGEVSSLGTPERDSTSVQWEVVKQKDVWTGEVHGLIESAESVSAMTGFGRPASTHGRIVVWPWGLFGRQRRGEAPPACSPTVAVQVATNVLTDRGAQIRWGGLDGAETWGVGVYARARGDHNYVLARSRPDDATDIVRRFIESEVLEVAVRLPVEAIDASRLILEWRLDGYALQRALTEDFGCSLEPAAE